MFIVSRSLQNKNKYLLRRRCPGRRELGTMQVPYSDSEQKLELAQRMATEERGFEYSSHSKGQGRQEPNCRLRSNECVLKFLGGGRRLVPHMNIGTVSPKGSMAGKGS